MSDTTDRYRKPDPSAADMDELLGPDQADKKDVAPEADLAKSDISETGEPAGTPGAAEADQSVDSSDDAGSADDDLPGRRAQRAAASEENAPAEPGKVRTGRGLAFFSLLVSAGALSLAAYLYFQLVMQQPLAPVEARIRGMESKADQLAGELESFRSGQTTTLAEFAAQQRAELNTAREGLIEAVNQVAKQAPPTSREWKIAEVAYLLRIANHRVLMERDVEAARDLLRAADEILLELDDFSFYQVRAALADELLALEAVKGNDVQGIYLRLEAVKRELSQLPLRVPEYLNARAVREAAEAEPESAWEALRQELSGYLRIRRFETNFKPLLSPEEAVYLELNLRLMLERSQLAALRREQVVYRQSLVTAAGWLAEYLDPSDEAVAHAVAELEALAEIELNLELPDISGSLAALQAVRRES